MTHVLFNNNLNNEKQEVNSSYFNTKWYTAGLHTHWCFQKGACDRLPLYQSKPWYVLFVLSWTLRPPILILFHSFIHFFNCLSFCRVLGGLEPIPAVTGWELHHRAYIKRQTIIHATIYSRQLTCTSLDSGRKPEKPERTHRHGENKHTPHRNPS